MRTLGLCALLPLLFGCTEPDPSYCDASRGCVTGMMCNAVQHQCLPVLDGGLGCNGSPDDEEVCNNGIDDNGDCLVDCEDPRCEGFAACPQLLGYGVATTSTSCGVQVASGPLCYRNVTQPTTCSGCQCTAECLVDVRSHDTLALCQTNASPLDAATLTSGIPCANLTKTLKGASWMYENARVRCVDGGALGRPDTTTPPRGLLCLPSTARRDCTTATCVAGLNLSGNICVMLSGEVSCPTRFPVRDRWYQGMSADNRKCACCTTAPAGSCSINVTLSTEASCKGSAASVSSICSAPNLGVDPKSVQLTVGSSPSCSTAGTVVSGAPVGQNPVTVCCLR